MKTAAFNTDILERIDPVMQGFVDRGQIAGLNVLVATREDTVYKNSYGFADLETGRAMGDDTIFRLYSMTKPVTATGALILFEEGQFGLFDPISAYIPSFKNPKVLTSIKDQDHYETEPARREIVIKDLFTQTAGLSYGFTDEGVDILYRRQLWDVMDSLDAKTAMDTIGKLPLAYHPGEKWLYSASIDVLGFLVEVITGTSLGDFLQERLFSPLGMRDTGFSVREEDADRTAVVYEPVDREDKERRDNLKPADNADPVIGAPPPFQSGGGGLYGTTRDYALFARMLVNGGIWNGKRILGRKTISLMASDHLAAEQKPFYNWDTQRGYSYGFGVRVMVDPGAGGKNGSVGEYGWDGAAGTWVWIDPEEGFVALMMPQLMPNAFHPVADRFIAGVYAALV